MLVVCFLLPLKREREKNLQLISSVCLGTPSLPAYYPLTIKS